MKRVALCLAVLVMGVALPEGSVRRHEAKQSVWREKSSSN
jgi:hypothetical protein